MTLPSSRLSSPSAADRGVVDLRCFLLGGWSLRRLIVDRESRCEYRFVGSATYSAASDGELAYTEEGLLTGRGHTGSASQRLIYRFTSPSRALVLFGDGRPFHELDLSTGRSRVLHDCAPDRYVGTFAVDGPDLVVRWRARGPRKSYVATSRFSPLAAGAPAARF